MLSSSQADLGPTVLLSESPKVEDDDPCNRVSRRATVERWKDVTADKLFLGVCKPFPELLNAV